MQRDRIFISYRRDDARGASGRLYDWLRIAYGRDRVFRDVHSIGVGKWRDKIDAALERSAVCIAVIGPRWADAENLPRLHDGSDMVRHELQTALAGGEITMVPTLVEGAAIPDPSRLPAPLRPLFDAWNARPVSEGGWEDDTRRLIDEIAEASGLSVLADLASLLHNVGAAKERIAEMQHEREIQAAQITALNETVRALERRLAEAPDNERPGLADAFGALARGDMLAAEEAFEREYASQAQAVEKLRGTMAEAARHVGNLASTHDVHKAVVHYRKALALDPDNVETTHLLGKALMLAGDLGGAEQAFSQSLRSAVETGDAQGEMFAYLACGDVWFARGDGPQALAAYRNSLAIAERLAARDPASKLARVDLSVPHERIGTVLLARGEGLQALEAFRNCLAIAETQMVLDPGNAQRQRDLAISHDWIGEALVAQGDMTRALAAFRDSLAIREAIAASRPADTLSQRELSVSHSKIGEMLRVQGDWPQALAAYRKGLQIAEALAARDRRNTLWQRDAAIAHLKISQVLLVQDQLPNALAACRQGLAIVEALAARDPVSSEWQRDLSIGNTTLGDVLFQQGDRPRALAAFRQSLAIAEALAARDPANTHLQRDLTMTHGRIGAVHLAQGDGPQALAAFRQGLAIAEALAARDPANPQWQFDIAASCADLGRVTPGQTAATRRAYLERARDIAEGLISTGRWVPSPGWTAWLDEQLATLGASPAHDRG